MQLSVSPLRMIPRAPSWEALYERYTGGPSSDGKLFLNIGRFAVRVGTGGDGELGEMDYSFVSLLMFKPMRETRYSHSTMSADSWSHAGGNSDTFVLTAFVRGGWHGMSRERMGSVYPSFTAAERLT